MNYDALSFLPSLFWFTFFFGLGVWAPRKKRWPQGQQGKEIAEIVKKQKKKKAGKKRVANENRMAKIRGQPPKYQKN